jgi:hypothetical protein
MSSELKTDFKTIDIKTMVTKLQNRLIELKKEGIKEEFDLENKLADENPEFYDEYPYLVKKLVSGGDISFLYKMLDTLDCVQKGKRSFAGAELELGSKLAQDYLYPTMKKEENRLKKNKK